MLNVGCSHKEQVIYGTSLQIHHDTKTQHLI